MFLFLKCAGDEVARGASDACVEDESLIFTYGGGYAVQSYSLVNQFLNDLISVVDLRNYNS